MYDFTNDTLIIDYYANVVSCTRDQMSSTEMGLRCFQKKVRL